MAQCQSRALSSLTPGTTALRSCLLHIRGFVVLATAVAPLHPGQTVVYGSDDAGDTIHKRSPMVEALVNSLADELQVADLPVKASTNLLAQLEDHTVHQRTDGKAVQLRLAGDVEGHCSL